MFIDRDAEFDWLEEGWRSGRPHFRILYGRRRTGKSALLDRFAEGKRTILFQAVEGTSADQLRDLTNAVLRCEDDQVLQAAPLANWSQALATFTRMGEQGQILIVLDEYQYAAQADPTLASQIQRWWSRSVGDLPIYLVLCGSYIRFFTENVLTGPAYGRNTGAWHLRPLDYRSVALFFPKWTHEDHIRVFAIAGGIPHYILQFDPDRSLNWNVQRHLLRRGSVLYQEAELLLREELREPRTHYSILRAIADGCTRIGEIANRVGTGSNPTPYLHTLQALGLASYDEPLAGKARRGIWTISDPYLRFWFRFVLPLRVYIEHGADPERLYLTRVQPALDHFVSKPTFEEVCRTWVATEGEIAGISDLGEIGAWWGPVPKPTPDNPRRQEEGEVEVIAVRDKQVKLIGEAKWTKDPVGFGVLNRLRQTAANIPGYSTETRLLLFGRAFDERLRGAALQEGVALIDVDDLFSHS